MLLPQLFEVGKPVLEGETSLTEASDRDPFPTGWI